LFELQHDFGILHGNGEGGAALRRIAQTCCEADRHLHFYHDVTMFADGHAQHAIRDQDTSEAGPRQNFSGLP
jgi:hypothetical protein